MPVGAIEESFNIQCYKMNNKDRKNKHNYI